MYYLPWLLVSAFGYGLAGMALIRFLNDGQNAEEFAIAALLIFVIVGFVDLYMNYRIGRKGRWISWWIGVILSLSTLIFWRFEYPQVVTFLSFTGGLILLQFPIWRKYPT